MSSLFPNPEKNSLRDRCIALLIALFSLSVPASVFPWGSLDDVRYKIKSADGNLWAPLLGGGSIVRGDERPGTITFTFDDGPDHRTTPVLLDELDRYGIKAAFFVNGSRFHPRTAGGPENQAVLRELFRRGHYVGSHTYSHRDIIGLDEEGWRTEVVQVEQVVRAVVGARPWLFRPPFGRAGKAEVEQLEAGGYTVVMWNLDPLDWKIGSATALLGSSRKLIEENPDGGVFLLHDTNKTTVEAFPLIIEWIEERNEQLRAEGRRTLDIVGLDEYIRARKR